MRLFDLWGAHVVGGADAAGPGVDVACAAATVGSRADLFAVFGGIAEDAGFFGHDLDCCCFSECAVRIGRATGGVGDDGGGGGVAARACWSLKADISF